MTDPSARQDGPQTEDGAPTQPAQGVQDASVDPVAAAKREAFEYKDRLLRTLAEMENLRKRTEREVTDARLYGIASFARDVLGVSDNMDRALQALRRAGFCVEYTTEATGGCLLAWRRMRT